MLRAPVGSSGPVHAHRPVRTVAPGRRRGPPPGHRRAGGRRDALRRLCDAHRGRPRRAGGRGQCVGEPGHDTRLRRLRPGDGRGPRAVRCRGRSRLFGGARRRRRRRCRRRAVRPLGTAGGALVAAGPGRVRHRPGGSRRGECRRRVDRPHPGRGRRARRRVAVPAHDGPAVAPGRDQHGHPHRAGDAGRPGRERGRGHRPPRTALPPRWRRRIRRPPARRDGPAHRGHPRHGAGHRGPGAPPCRRCHALVAGAATPDGAASCPGPTTTRASS